MGGEANDEGLELGPLPAGHHGLTPEQVAESQRERLLAATARLVAERGYRDATITEIAKAASVANRVFYQNFADREQAFLAAFDALVDYLRMVMEEAARGAADWPAAMVAGLAAAVEFLESDPEVGRFLLVAPLTATPAIAAHFRETLEEVVPALEAGRAERPDGARLPASTEESLVGGVLTQLGRRLGEDLQLAPLLPDLVEFVLAPYLGVQEAGRRAAEVGSLGK